MTRSALVLPLLVACGCSTGNFLTPRHPSVTAGEQHACAVQDDGSLWCWGADYNGQLGDDSTLSRPEPRRVDGDWSSSDAGRSFTCAIRRDGSLWCWGSNYYSQLGDGTNAAIRAVPVEVTSGGLWKQVSAGSRHACGIRADQTLWCWGANESGQLGDGTNEMRRDPQQVAGWWDEVHAGDVHTCARAGGRVSCWGSNAMGLLGIDEADTGSLVPARVAGNDWRSLRVGPLGACAIGDGSTLSCWGRGFGFAPEVVPGEWIEVSVGTAGGTYSEVCAIAASDGSIRCWYPDQPGVEDPLEGTDFVSLSVGDGFGCATKADRSTWCWGDGTYGQRGSDPKTEVHTPAEVGSVWSDISAGPMHTCGIQTDGTLWCWGSDVDGVLGNGSEGGAISPELVSGSGWTSVSTKSNTFLSAHSCALRGDTSLWCWGGNDDGQLGLGSTESHDTPALVGTGWSSVETGGAHACGTRLDETLWCWGWNYHGQLGIGSYVSQSMPAQIAGSWENVTTGDYHTCATRTDGSLWCWGLGYLASPEAVSGSVSMVDAGSRHTCAVTTAQSITCWGEDDYGQSSHAPSVGAWLSVSAGEYHSCGVRDDHTLWCWGRNDGGKLGDGTTTSTTGSPVQVPGGEWSKVTAASGNLYWGHTCATKLDGSLWCWGHNLVGELGLGVAGVQPDPVLVTGLDGGAQ